MDYNQNLSHTQLLHTPAFLAKKGQAHLGESKQKSVMAVINLLQAAIILRDTPMVKLIAEKFSDIGSIFIYEMTFPFLRNKLILNKKYAIFIYTRNCSTPQYMIRKN